jgi:oxygen-independent coproporphyrinogen III oxidase
MTLGIYIQVPFCHTKCTYCNFHTGVVSRERYEPYVAAVCKEIRIWGHFLTSEADWRGNSEETFLGPEPIEAVASTAGLKLRASATKTPPPQAAIVVDAVYLGGGTPSLLDPQALACLIETLRSSFDLAATSEITLEADPETISGEKASAWLEAGFNRISLGAQSFNDSELKSAGRMHRRADIYRVVECLHTAGFADISMDLIAGLPHQTRAAWDESITELIGLRPEHASIYMLEIDEGSRLGREAMAGGLRYGADAIPSDDAIADFYESGCERLASAGYEHYEISNWALPGFRSRHNLKYWRREPYLGFGAGAHSFDGHTRWANIHDSARYVECLEQGQSPGEQIETVTPQQALDEEFFLGLRQLEGIDLAPFPSMYGGHGLQDRLTSLWNRIQDLRRQGLVELEGTRLRLAPHRLTVSNEVLVALLG